MRSDHQVWQGVAGGGLEGESPHTAAVREVHEEISVDSKVYALDTVSSIPRCHFRDVEHWDDSVFVIPEFAFAVDCGQQPIVLSDEHSDFRWGSLAEISALYRWDSNRTALWELHQRLSDSALAAEPMHAGEICLGNGPGNTGRFASTGDFDVWINCSE